MVDIGLYAITPYQFRIANDLNLDNFLSPTTEERQIVDNADTNGDISPRDQFPYAKDSEGNSNVRNGYHKKDARQLDPGVFTLKLEKRPEKRERSRSGSDVISPEPKRNGPGHSDIVERRSCDVDTTGNASSRRSSSDDSDKTTTPNLGHPDESMFMSYNSDDVIIVVRDDDESKGDDVTTVTTENHGAALTEVAQTNTGESQPEDCPCEQTVVMRRKRRPRKLPQIPASVQRKSAVACLMKAHSLAAELCDADPVTTKDQRASKAKSWIESSTFSHGSSQDGSIFNYSYQSLEELGSPEVVDSVHLEQVEKDIIHMTMSMSETNLGHVLHDGDQDQKRSSPSESIPSCMTMSLRDELESEGIPINNDLGSAFCDYSEYIDDEMPKLTKYFGEDVGSQANSRAGSANNRAGSSTHRRSETWGEQASGNSASATEEGSRNSWDSYSPLGSRRRNSSSSTCSDLEAYDATHRGCHKFVPRHNDEMFIEIGDYIFVEDEADDLWCEGINLRTGQHGIFPAAYATDLSLLENDGISKFKLRFLGSVEVTQHKGDDVICTAIQKVAKSREKSTNQAPAPLYCLEINEYGIKMIDVSKKSKRTSPKRSSIRERLAKILKKEIKKEETNDFFFSLKNVSFCGYHPKNERYFAFITKHPLESRFACHVFLSHRSTKPIAEAIGAAFKKFYEEYMIFMHQTEDIYIE